MKHKKRAILIAVLFSILYVPQGFASWALTIDEMEEITGMSWEDVRKKPTQVLQKIIKEEDQEEMKEVLKDLGDSFCLAVMAGLRQGPLHGTYHHYEHAEADLYFKAPGTLTCVSPDSDRVLPDVQNFQMWSFKRQRYFLFVDVLGKCFSDRTKELKKRRLDLKKKVGQKYSDTDAKQKEIDFFVSSGTYVHHMQPIEGEEEEALDILKQMWLQNIKITVFDQAPYLRPMPKRRSSLGETIVDLFYPKSLSFSVDEGEKKNYMKDKMEGLGMIRKG